MNINQIQDLIKFVAKSGVSEVEIEQKDFKITIKTHEPERKGKGGELMVPAQMMMAPQVAAAPVAAAPVAAPATAPAPAAPRPEATEPKGNFIEIKSPMIGTFYRSSAPDKPPFVEVGKDIRAGEVLCVIEAMKLFNEIESEITGKIVKVLVSDSTPVEYDQPLFLVEPA
jgi:acetyl-CoA carboxylase biotin carboxyl carrier protein